MKAAAKKTAKKAMGAANATAALVKPGKKGADSSTPKSRKPALALDKQSKEEKTSEAKPVEFEKPEVEVVPDKPPQKALPDMLAADVQPPKIVQAVVLFQAQTRRKKFLKDYGPDAFETHKEIAPLPPQMVRGLYLCRRMIKPHFTNIGKECMAITQLLLEGRPPLRIMRDCLTRYSRALSEHHPAVRLLDEKTHSIAVEATEAAKYRFLPEVMKAERDPATQSVTWYMRNAIDLVIAEYDIPISDLEDCVGKCEKTLRDHLDEKSHQMGEKLRISANSYAINEVKKEAMYELSGSLVDCEEFLGKVTRAIKQRQKYLESELLTRWDYPLHGCLGPYEYAVLQYEAELGEYHQLVTDFVSEVDTLRRKYEYRFKLESAQLIAELKKLESDKTKAPQVKTIIRHFQSQIDTKTKEAHEHMINWGNLYGFDKQHYLTYCTKLCGLEVTKGFYRDAIKRLVGEIRQTNLSEETEQKMIARYHFGKNYLHTLMDIAEQEFLNDNADPELEAEIIAFRAEIPDIRYQQIVGTTKDEGPTGLTKDGQSVTGELQKQNINLPHGFSSIQLLSHVATRNFFTGAPEEKNESGHLSTLDLLNRFENMEATFNAKKRDGEMIGTLGDNMITLKGLSYNTLKSPMPTGDMVQPDPTTGLQSTWDAIREEASAPMELHPRIAEESRTSDAPVEIDPIICQLTVNDMSLEDLRKNFDEALLAKKFARALAGACDINPVRLKILGFMPDNQTLAKKNTVAVNKKSPQKGK